MKMIEEEQKKGLEVHIGGFSQGCVISMSTLVRQGV